MKYKNTYEVHNNFNFILTSFLSSFEGNCFRFVISRISVTVIHSWLLHFVYFAYLYFRNSE
jgi:hypothetical protein